jgi:hypothetical protein
MAGFLWKNPAGLRSNPGEAGGEGPGGGAHGYLESLVEG